MYVYCNYKLNKKIYLLLDDKNGGIKLWFRRFIKNNIDKVSNPRVRPNIISPLPQLGQVSPN